MRDPVGIIAALVISAIVLVAPASAAIVFSDNFNAGAAADWGNQSGNWRDTGGQYDAASPDNSPNTYTDVTTLTGLTDFVVDVDVNDVDDGGVWLRSSYNSGAISGVLLVTGGFSGSNNGFYWHIVQNGSFSGVLQATGFAGLQGADVHLRIEVVGNSYSLFVNGSGTAQSVLTSAAIASGSVGLYDFSPINGAASPRGQTFDNFVVNDLTTVGEPATLALAGLGLIGLGVVRRRNRSR